jgi:hypothetical protein
MKSRSCEAAILGRFAQCQFLDTEMIVSEEVL